MSIAQPSVRPSQSRVIKPCLFISRAAISAPHSSKAVKYSPPVIILFLILHCFFGTRRFAASLLPIINGFCPSCKNYIAPAREKAHKNRVARQFLLD